ncbi:MAG TPA: twin-arginine translocation signal domain-containing protein [Rhodocyclaceae bacterium]|nr:twin-arginine translocation signal domain-containing protein [Rhodocyclaceae bacterium]
MLTRRQLLKGAAVAGPLMAGGWAFWPHGTPPSADPDAEKADSYGFLQATDRRILAALMPALLGTESGNEQIRADGQQVLRDIDATIVRQRASIQDELRQLFILLATHAGSYALLGVADVATAPAEALARGLDVLRTREFAQFRQAYGGLRDLILGLWYGQPEHWQQIHYPGPPDLMKGPRL